jgi:hypothetical protein
VIRVRVRFGAFEAAAIEVRSSARVVWQKGTQHTVRKLTKEEEAEAREAMRRGDGARLEWVCECAERLELGLEMTGALTLDWDREPDSDPPKTTEQKITGERGFDRSEMEMYRRGAGQGVLGQETTGTGTLGWDRDPGSGPPSATEQQATGERVFNRSKMEMGRRGTTHGGAETEDERTSKLATDCTSSQDRKAKGGHRIEETDRKSEQERSRERAGCGEADWQGSDSEWTLGTEEWIEHGEFGKKFQEIPQTCGGE